MNDARIRIPAPALAAVVVILALAVLLLSPARDTLVGLVPVATADPAVLSSQRGAAEAGIERAHRTAVAQVKRIRGFNLAITQAQADVIERKAYDDLAVTRRAAVVSIGQAFKMSQAELGAYIPAAEARMAELGDGPVTTVLAPSLYEVVRLAGDKLVKIAEAASTELTGPPRPSPSASPR